MKYLTLVVNVQCENKTDTKRSRKMLFLIFLLSTTISAVRGDCSQPKDTGSVCGDGVAAARSFYYDTRTKVCQPFLYTGCGGNDNRFATSKECRDTCQNKKPTSSATTSPQASNNTILDDTDSATSPNSPPFVPKGNAHDQWRKAEICGSNYLIPNGKYIVCSANQPCPKFHSCVNGACCPSKDYVCSLRDDNGSFLDGVEDRPRFSWNHEVQSCTRWSYYGVYRGTIIHL
uniref:BPTI/Kunitz inhibitor domain-containing protein n=1 Tax=Caenorhabditis japonica TaxID=281687 RepID=A0A8R1HL76_CAEJA